jgi:hypothetical protein
LFPLVGLAAGFAADEPSRAVEEITTAFEREAAAVQLETAEELSKAKLEAIERLQKIQDRLCRDAKLDEAVAVRDRIRKLTGTNPPATECALPADAAEIAHAFEVRAAALERKAIERVEDAGRRAAAPLERLLSQLCREEKLDEAMEVRNIVRRLTGVITDVRPDPGYLSAQASDHGKVWYFEVTGAHSGSIYGTDVYTSDSSLATAAVHSNVLKVGEKGIVRVTILPGQSHYVSSWRNGITSSAYGQWHTSFKVERAYGIVRSTLKPCGDAH